MTNKIDTLPEAFDCPICKHAMEFDAGDIMDGRLASPACWQCGNCGTIVPLRAIAAEKRVAQTVEAEREELAKQFDKMSLRYVDAHWPLLADRLKKGATLLRTPGPVIPPGWVLVPEDATQEMVAAAEAVDWTGGDGDEDAVTHNVWQAMLAAAPKYEGEK